MPFRHTREEIMMLPLASGFDWALMDVWVCDEGCNLKFKTPHEAADHFGKYHSNGRYTERGKPCQLGCGWRGPTGHHWVHYVREHMNKKRRKKNCR